MQKYPNNFWITDGGFAIVAIGADINKMGNERIVDDNKWYKLTIRVRDFSSKWTFARILCNIVWRTSYSRRLLAQKYHED